MANHIETHSCPPENLIHTQQRMCFNIIAWATLFHGRPQAGVVALSEHCLADGRRSVYAAMLSETPETPHCNAESMFR